MQLDVVNVVLKPLLNLGTFVIADVVGDHVYSFARILADHLLEQGEKGVGVEFLSKAEMPLRVLSEYYSPEHLDAFPGGITLDVTAFAPKTPGTSNRSRLLEGCFILMGLNSAIGLNFVLYFR